MHARASIGCAALAAVLCLLTPRVSSGFCGFYVAGADTQLYNNATMVVMMREGTRTVLSMQNNYQGPPEDFAMVVPVPVVLQEDNVKTLKRSIFDRVDKLAAPRLVEYWEQDPCQQFPGGRGFGTIGTGNFGTIGYGSGAGFGGKPQVVVEAEFSVGEYDIVILSAKDALALESWLTGNGYKIPSGAAAYLKPYVERGEKFFVAKVDVKKVKYQDGMATLSPLRVHYDHADFSLPIRLGLINAKDAQDLIVHILARNKRYEVANYENVTIPTNLSVRDGVRDRFGEFYAALFDATLEKNPKSVVTEYAWDASSCDPCPEPALDDSELYTLGLDVLDGNKPPPKRSNMRMGGAAVVQGDLDKNIIRRYLRRKLPRMRACHQTAIDTEPSFTGAVELDFTIDATGMVEKAKVGKLPKGKAAGKFKTCFESVIRSIRFPKPKGGGLVKVKQRYLANAGQTTFVSRGFVLTRLHARYNKDNLGEDLVFKVADAIAGGQGGGEPKEKGARPSSQNTFQGRYIIHHPWTGAVTCESPQRGIWGGPPANKPDKPTLVARDLAFAPRGGMALTAMVAEPIVALDKQPTPPPANDTAKTPTPADGKRPPETPSVGTSPTPDPGTQQAPETEPGKRSSGCAAGGSLPGPLSWALMALLGALLWRRRAVLDQ